LRPPAGGGSKGGPRQRGAGERRVVGATGAIPGVGSGADPENAYARPRAAAAGGNATLWTSRARKARVLGSSRGARPEENPFAVRQSTRFTEEPMDKPTTVDRRKFLGALGVTVGGTGLAGAGLVAGPQLVKAAAEPPKGKIPDTPYRTGHMTFFTSPAAVLG